MAAFPGYYTGNDGELKFDNGAVLVGEFEVAITRGVAAHARSGKYSDLKLPGKVTFRGSIKRLMKGGELMQTLIGTGDPSSNASAGPTSVGDATIFDFVGKVDDDSNSVVITADNCFFTEGADIIGDGLIEETFAFVMKDEDADLTVQHTTT